MSASTIRSMFVELWISRQPLHQLSTCHLGHANTFKHSFLRRNFSTSTLKRTAANDNAVRKTTQAAVDKKAPWTSEADAQLLSLRVNQNKKWLEIGQALNREPATCMARFESTLKPELDDFWTSEKISQLENLVASAKPWSAISQTLGCHRLACIEKWRQLSAAAVTSSLDPSPPKKKTRSKKERTKDTSSPQSTLPNLKSIESVVKDLDIKSWNSLLTDEDRYRHHRLWKKKSATGVLDGPSPLYLMNPGWSAKEETILIQHVLQYGLDQWELAANGRLRGRFSAQECRACWKTLDMYSVLAHEQGLSKQDTTEASPNALNKVRKADNSQSTRAETLDDRLLVQHPRDETSTEQPILTKQQQYQYWSLWRNYGEEWEHISEAMGTLTPSECHAYYSGIRKHFKGSEEEIQQKILKLAASMHEPPASQKDSNQQEGSSRVQQSQSWPASSSLFDGDADDDDNDADDSGDEDDESEGSDVVGANAGGSTTVRKGPFVWNKELSVRLRAIVRKSYKSREVHVDQINWLWISRRVHPDASSRVCENHWKFLHKGQVSWTHEDIKRLEEGVRMFGPKKMAAIRDHYLPHMTKDEVTRQWFLISDKAATISNEEYYMLHQAVREHGEDQWDKVVLAMQSVSPGWKKLPCQRVWESSYVYLMRHGGSPWTPILDTTLLRTVDFVGRDDWFSVAKVLQNGKSAWQCRLRWCQLIDPVTVES
ncbi:hypothetical protein BGZ94_004635 [Podila epigama]|nr:hypothetical protein BGZ94_004635 [Podila epigama]